MKLGSILAVLLMLVLVSGEISTISSPAPAPELALEAADSPPIPAPMPEVGSPVLAEYPNEYSSPPEVGSPALAEYPNEYSSPPEVGSPALAEYPNEYSSPLGSPLAEYPNVYYYPLSDSTPPPAAGDANYNDITGVDEKKTLGRKGYSAY